MKEHDLLYVSNNVQNYKICVTCDHINWFENDFCIECKNDDFVEDEASVEVRIEEEMFWVYQSQPESQPEDIIMEV